MGIKWHLAEGCFFVQLCYAGCSIRMHECITTKRDYSENGF